MTTSDDGPRQRAQRIADDLRAEIAAGRIPPGGKLPVNRELADRYGVARATAERAVSLLEAEGLVVSRHGSGTYVRRLHPVRRLGPDRYARHRWQHTVVDAYADDRPGSDHAEQQGSQTQTVELVPADERVAEAFGIAPGTLVYERARVVTREGVATHIMTSYYPPGTVDGTPLTDPRPGIAGSSGGFEVLAALGLVPHQITEDLFARMPAASEARVLDLPPGEPVVELHRTTRTAEGRVIEYARGVHAASRFVWSFTYDIPD
jgi:GntR family transcriptional regulator